MSFTIRVRRKKRLKAGEDVKLANVSSATNFEKKTTRKRAQGKDRDAVFEN